MYWTIDEVSNYCCSLVPVNISSLPSAKAPKPIHISVFLWPSQLTAYANKWHRNLAVASLKHSVMDLVVKSDRSKSHLWMQCCTTETTEDTGREKLLAYSMNVLRMVHVRRSFLNSWPPGGDTRIIWPINKCKCAHAWFKVWHTWLMWNQPNWINEKVNCI